MLCRLNQLNTLQTDTTKNVVTPKNRRLLVYNLRMRYFYWGPKHVILRPCGKDDFSLSGLNSYLTGFDLRPKHNYYVYATNVISDNEDIGYGFGDDKYYMKNHDKSITNWLYFLGDF